MKLESKKDEATGRMMMVPIEGSEFALEAELVPVSYTHLDVYKRQGLAQAQKELP